MIIYIVIAVVLILLFPAACIGAGWLVDRAYKGDE